MKRKTGLFSLGLDPGYPGLMLQGRGDSVPTFVSRLSSMKVMTFLDAYEDGQIKGAHRGKLGSALVLILK